MPFRITEARWPDDRTTVEALFREYVSSLAEDISFQNVDDELAGLPGNYARPGGVVLVVDFSPHDLVELKREHAHVHLGFADNQVQGWLKSAGLNPLEPIHFPGRRIMTGIWRGERELPARTAARHSAHPVHGVSR